jgi:Flp pilus assembly protein TadB
MYGTRWQLPPNPRLTLALLALWLLLAAYIVWTRNTLGYVILALVFIFVFLPALLIWLGTRRASQRTNDDLPGMDGDESPRDDAEDS